MGSYLSEDGLSDEFLSFFGGMNTVGAKQIVGIPKIKKGRANVQQSATAFGGNPGYEGGVTLMKAVDVIFVPKPC